MKRRVEKTKTKWRDHNGSQLQSLTVSDDLGDYLLSALDSKNGGTKGVAVAAV
jgi:hypothetical protein